MKKQLLQENAIFKTRKCIFPRNKFHSSPNIQNKLRRVYLLIKAKEMVQINDTSKKQNSPGTGKRCCTRSGPVSYTPSQALNTAVPKTETI